MNLAELLTLALPGGTAASVGKSTGALNASIPTVEGAGDEFSNLLDPLLAPPPTPMEASLAPPGDPPPGETTSGERGELKTKEPNAPSMKPDSPQALSELTQFLAALTVKPTLNPLSTESPEIKQGSPDPSAESVAPALADGFSIKTVIAEAPVSVPVAPEPAAPQPVAPQPTGSEPAATHPANPVKPENPEHNPLQKGQPSASDPKTTEAVVEPKTESAKALTPVATPAKSGETESPTVSNVLATAEQQDTSDAPESDRDATDHRSSGERKPQPEPVAATATPARTETPALDREPRPVDNVRNRELQSRLDAVADRAELLHATRHGVRIELQTPDLGMIEFAVRQQGDAVSTQLSVENRDVRQALLAAQPRMEKAMEDRGLTLREFNVSSTMSDAQHHQSPAHRHAPTTNGFVPTRGRDTHAADPTPRTPVYGRGLDLAI